jgi:protein-disulfide isomerase
MRERVEGHGVTNGVGLSLQFHLRHGMACTYRLPGETMTFSRSIRLLLAGAALLATGKPALAQQDDDSGGWKTAMHVDALRPGERVHGNPSAGLSLIVWLDPECPYCKVLGDMPERVVNGSAGKVNLAVRLYPLPFHGQNAVLASLTALCVGDQAGDAGYYRFLDKWLELTAGNGKGIPSGTGRASDPVAALATAAGARNRDALANCTTASATSQRLTEDMRSAERARIGGTPAIAVRNNDTGETMMVAGAIEEPELQAAIKYMAQRNPQ